MSERIPTRRGARTVLAGAGVTGPAAELFLDSTASARHAARVGRLVAAALDEASRVTSHELATRFSFAPAFAPLYGIAVLVLDAFGVVDEKSGPNERTAKIQHRAFRTDCGPRTGPASGARNAAARDAVDVLYRQATGFTGGPAEVVVRPDRGDMAAIEIEVVPPSGASSFVQLFVDPMPGFDSPAPSWMSTIALEGLRRAYGAPPWFVLGDARKAGPGETRPSPHVLDVVRLDGDLAGWGAILAQLVARARVDAIDAGIVALMTEFFRSAPPIPEHGRTLFEMKRYAHPGSRRATLADLDHWISAELDAHAAATVGAALHNNDTPAAFVVDLIEASIYGLRTWIVEAEMYAREECRDLIDGLDRLEDPHPIDPDMHLAGAALLIMLARGELVGGDRAPVDPHDSKGRDVAEARTMVALDAAAKRYGVPSLIPDPTLGLVFASAPEVVIDVDDASAHTGRIDGFAKLARRVAECAPDVATEAPATLPRFPMPIEGSRTEWLALADDLEIDDEDEV